MGVITAGFYLLCTGSRGAPGVQGESASQQGREEGSSLYFSQVCGEGDFAYAVNDCPTPSLTPASFSYRVWRAGRGFILSTCPCMCPGHGASPSHPQLPELCRCSLDTGGQTGDLWQVERGTVRARVTPRKLISLCWTLPGQVRQQRQSQLTGIINSVWAPAMARAPMAWLHLSLEPHIRVEDESG